MVARINDSLVQNAAFRSYALMRILKTTRNVMAALREEWDHSSTFINSMVGIFGSLFLVAGFTFGFEQRYVAMSVLFLTFFFLLWRVGFRKKGSTVPDDVVDEILFDLRRANADDFSAIWTLAKDAFSEEALNQDLLRNVLTNPGFGFFVAFDSLGDDEEGAPKLLGYLDAYTLDSTSERVQKFLKGDISEADLDVGDLLPINAENMHPDCIIYVAGLVISQDRSSETFTRAAIKHRNQQILRELITAFVSSVAKLMKAKNVDECVFVTLGQTRAGRSFSRRLNLREIGKIKGGVTCIYQEKWDAREMRARMKKYLPASSSVE
jgi:hypothetical protein